MSNSAYDTDCFFRTKEGAVNPSRASNQEVWNCYPIHAYIEGSSRELTDKNINVVSTGIFLRIANGVQARLVTSSENLDKGLELVECHIPNAKPAELKAYIRLNGMSKYKLSNRDLLGYLVLLEGRDPRKLNFKNDANHSFIKDEDIT